MLDILSLQNVINCARNRDVSQNFPRKKLTMILEYVRIVLYTGIKFGPNLVPVYIPANTAPFPSLDSEDST